MDEGYPPDYDGLPESRDYLIERNGRYGVLYTKYGTVAHLWNDGSAGVMCGTDTWVEWLGTGSLQEREKAHRLPVCKRCMSALGHTELLREDEPR